MSNLSQHIGIQDSSITWKRNWFFLNESDGAKRGPFSLCEMERYASKLAIRPRTKVWHESLGKWTSAWLVNGIFSRRSSDVSSRIILAPGMPVQGVEPHSKVRAKLSGKLFSITTWILNVGVLLLTLLSGVILNIDGRVGLLAFGYYGLPMLWSIILLTPISLGLGLIARRRSAQTLIGLALGIPVVVLIFILSLFVGFG